MKPEQKADELYNKFWNHALDSTQARDVAIACVKEIIKAVDDFDNELYEHEGMRSPAHKVYYENVLYHLKSYDG